MVDIMNILNEESVIRLLYIFFMCILIRCIGTIKSITQVNGQKFATSCLISLDTLVFLLVFKNLIFGDITKEVILTVALGYIIGYYLGAYVESKLALGKVLISIKISKEKSKDLFQILGDNGFIFARSKRFYSHKGKPRKIYSGVIFRKELPKLKKITKDLNVICVVETVKQTFGKEIISSKKYLKLNS